MGRNPGVGPWYQLQNSLNFAACSVYQLNCKNTTSIWTNKKSTGSDIRRMEGKEDPGFSPLQKLWLTCGWQSFYKISNTSGRELQNPRQARSQRQASGHTQVKLFCFNYFNPSPGVIAHKRDYSSTRSFTLGKGNEKQKYV